VFRSPDGWIVKLDLAGIRIDDLEIQLRDTLLSIRGCRRDTHYREGLFTIRWKLPIAVLRSRFSFRRRSKERRLFAITVTDS